MEEEDEKDHLDYRKTPLALLKKKRNSSQVNMSEAALELGSGGTYFKSKRSDNMVSTYGGEDEVTSLTSTQTSKKRPDKPGKFSNTAELPGKPSILGGKRVAGKKPPYHKSTR